MSSLSGARDLLSRRCARGLPLTHPSPQTVLTRNCAGVCHQTGRFRSSCCRWLQRLRLTPWRVIGFARPSRSFVL